MRFQRPITAVVVGYGNRGSTYAKYALERPDLMTVVGVAEPRPFIRSSAVQRHAIADASMVFEGWQALVATGQRLADAAIICTQDRDHVGPAVALAGLGYHILLEKPMAQSEDDCRTIVSAVKAAGVLFAVGHVLRYTPFMQKIISILRSGELGDVINVQHLEPIGHAHFAHSFVRGNWRNEADSSFMLLAKCCHDIDLLRFMVAKPCVSISSFGSLHHFTSEKKPAEARGATRCVSCPMEPDCQWSAKKIYLEQAVRQEREWSLKATTTAAAGEATATPTVSPPASINPSSPLSPSPAVAPVAPPQPLTFTWPVNVLLDGPHSVPAVEDALANGPYGRCVYGECGNDVCDNQVVSLQFEGGATATLTTVAFTELVCQRQIRIFGTRGELDCRCSTGPEGDTIKHFDFLTRKSSVHSGFKAPITTGLQGHGGADYFLAASFVRAVGVAVGAASIHLPSMPVSAAASAVPASAATVDVSSPSERLAAASPLVLSGPDETLESHLMVFAAEKARREQLGMLQGPALTRKLSSSAGV